MCGICGIVNVRKAPEVTAVILHYNQHRANDYVGIVSSDGSQIFREAGPGLARQFFTKEKLDNLHGKDALGHVRYPTVADDPSLENIQPIVGSYGTMPVAIVHNGNITNVSELKALVPDEKFTTSMDTEVILRLLEMHPSGDFEADLVTVLKMLEGSFSLGILIPDCLIAIRDRHGNRPLSIGKLNGGYCISSETCAFPGVDAEFVSEIEPGTMVFIRRDRFDVKRFAEPREKKCRFEGIYFSHPASKVFGEEVGRFRIAIGRALEDLFPVPDADIVIGVPDSANFIAMGYAASGRSGMYFPAIMRSHYVGRTFIAATQANRDAEVTQKFIFSTDEIAGKTIVVVDDSIVRGTTMPKIVAKLWQFGAKSVHVRIGSPPIAHPCIYGINTPTHKELMASSLTVDTMREKMGADSLEFLSLETLKTLSPNPDTFCYACMNGEYW
jgi:amidophosphoribosyltransferase